MRGPWGAVLLLAGVLLLTAGWLPEVLLLPPVGDPEVEAPVDLCFDGQGRLRIVDQDGGRLVTVSPEGILEAAVRPTGPLTPASSEAGPDAGAREAWSAGLDPVRFRRLAASPAGGRAWLDPWTGTVLWAPASGGPPRRIHHLTVPTPLRTALLLWWTVAAVAVGLSLLTGIRAAWRWLRQPGIVAVRLAVVTVPWAVATAGLGWWSLEENLGPRDDAVLTGRMLLAGLAAAEGRPAAVADDLEVRVFRPGPGGLEPAPTGGPVEAFRAALRSGRPQVVREGGLTVVVPGAGAGPETGALAEVRWKETPRWLHLAAPDRLAAGAGWVAVSAVFFAGLVWLPRRMRPARPADPDRFQDPDPWRAFSPRQWVELLGPDVLGPLGREAGVLRSVAVLTWSGEDPDWAPHLGLWGALEVPTDGGCRRAVVPGGLAFTAEALADWTRQGRTPPDLAVEVGRAAFGFVDTGFRQEPLVQGLPPAVPPGPGLTIEPRLRRRWDRLLSVANRRRSR